MRNASPAGPKQKVSRTLTAAVLLLASLSAGAATSPLARCAAIVEDGDRLACYDGIARQQALKLPAPAPPAPPATSAADPVAPPAADPVADFGRNAQMQEAPAEPEPKLATLNASIIEIGKRARGERLFFLDNGQIWAETERKSGGNFRKGTAVEIRRGKFGGYRLFGRGNRGYRVERLK